MNVFFGLHFVYPSVLWWAPLCLLPLLLHLAFRLGKKKQYVPSLFILLQVKKKLGMKHEYPFWLILLEMLFLFFLLLGFARPYQAEQNQTELIFLDNSPSLFLTSQGESDFDWMSGELRKKIKNKNTFYLLSWKEIKNGHVPAEITSLNELEHYLEELSIENTGISFRELDHYFKTSEALLAARGVSVVYVGDWVKARFKESFVSKVAIKAWVRKNRSALLFPEIKNWKTTLFTGEGFDLEVSWQRRGSAENVPLRLDECFGSKQQVATRWTSVFSPGTASSSIHLLKSKIGLSFYVLSGAEESKFSPQVFSAVKSVDDFSLRFVGNGKEKMAQKLRALLVYDFEKGHLKEILNSKIDVYLPESKTDFTQVDVSKINIFFMGPSSVSLDCRAFFKELQFISPSERKKESEAFFHLEKGLSRIPGLVGWDNHTIHFSSYQKALGGEVLLRFSTGDPFLIRLGNSYLFTVSGLSSEGNLFDHPASIPLFLELFSYANSLEKKERITECDPPSFVSIQGKKSLVPVVTSTCPRYQIKPGIYDAADEWIVVNDAPELYEALEEKVVKTFFPNLKIVEYQNENAVENQSLFLTYTRLSFCFSFIFLILLLIFSHWLYLSGREGLA